MDSAKAYELYCHFCGIGKKTVKASSFEAAKQMLEDNKHVQFDEIIRLTKPCWVDKAISKETTDHTNEEHQLTDYANWGSE